MIQINHLSMAYRTSFAATHERSRLSRTVRRAEKKIALNDVTFHVARGETVALLGRNGAGKSTLVKMLAGVLTPTSGSCRVAGIDPHAQRTANARNIGVVFGQRSQLWWDLPVQESFRILAKLYDIKKSDAEEQWAVFEDVLHIDEIARQPVRTLSLGQRMRAEVAAATYHRPPLLLLDEPTIGLDVVLKDAVQRLVAHMVKEQGTTLMLTSHDVADITALCDRAVIIDQSRIVHDGPVDDLVRSAPDRSIEIEWVQGPPSTEVRAALAHRLGEAIHLDETGPRRLTVAGPKELVKPAHVVGLLQDMVQISDLVAPEPSLAQVLRSVYSAGGMR